MFIKGKICVSARVGKSFTKCCPRRENDISDYMSPRSFIQTVNALCLTKKLFIKVTMVRRSRLGFFLLQGKVLCFAHVGKSLARCLFLKWCKDLVEKIISPVKFDTNCSFKQ